MKRRTENNRPFDFSPRAFLWILILLAGGTSLIIIPDVNNSTLFKPYILYACSAMLFAVGLLWMFSQNTLEVRLSALHLSAFLYLLVSAISLCNAHNMRLGIEALAMQMSLFLVFVSVSFMATSETDIKAFYKFVLFIVLPTFIAGLIQALSLLPSSVTILGSGREVISTLGNATYFAGYLVILIPIILGFIMSMKKGMTAQGALLACLVVAIFLLIKTESRSAWLAAIVGITMFVLLNFKQRKHRLIGISIIVLSLVIGFFFFPEVIQKRLTNMFDLNPQSSFARRLFFYEGAWKAFLSSPALGNGLGNFVVFLPKFRAPDYWIYQSEDIVPHAHNEFLEILSETGIIGFCAFLVFLIIFFVSMFKNMRDITNPKRPLLVGYVCAILSVLVDNVFSLNLRTVPVAVAFWIILGLSQQHVSTNIFAREFKIPILLRKLRWFPVVVLALFLWWLVHLSIVKYKTERTVLEGNIKTWRKDEQGAKEKFSEALSYDSTHYLARYYLSASLLKQAQHKEAREHIVRLIHDYPYAPKTHLIVALSSFELGDTAKAFEAIQKEIELENSPQPYYYYAYFESRLGNSQREFELLETMLNRNIEGKVTDFAVMGIERIAFLSKDANKVRCLNLLQEIRKAFSHDAYILITLAESYFRLGINSEATAILQQTQLIQNTDKQLRSRIDHLNAMLNSIQTSS